MTLRRIVTLHRLCPALLVVGAALLLGFEHPLTLALGVASLFGFIASGVFLVASPGFLDADQD